MRVLCVAAGSILLGCNVAGLCQSEVACGQPLNFPLHSRSVLAVESRPAGLEVVATDDEMVRVSCSSDDAEVAQHIRLRFSGSASDGKLTVDGGYVKHGNLRIRIEVPRKTNLSIRMPAGEVKTEGVAGNKDIELYAGRIAISSSDAWNYRTLDASVVIGAVNAPAYGVQKGGFFRSLKRDAADGEYHLRASVVTGEIELSGRSPHATAD